MARCKRIPFTIGQAAVELDSDRLAVAGTVKFLGVQTAKHPVNALAKAITEVDIDDLETRPIPGDVSKDPCGQGHEGCRGRACRGPHPASSEASLPRYARKGLRPRPCGGDGHMDVRVGAEYPPVRRPVKRGEGCRTVLREPRRSARRFFHHGRRDMIGGGISAKEGSVSGRIGE